MNSQSRQEGYNDGLAGSGMQDRTSSSPRDWFDDTLYREGFLAGSADRWVMLRADAGKATQP
jgi:hypothetical protein